MVQRSVRVGKIILEEYENEGMKKYIVCAKFYFHLRMEILRNYIIIYC